MIKIENSGDRRKDRQTLDDRLREIKREEGWVDIADMIQNLKVSRTAST